MAMFHLISLRVVFQFRILLFSFNLIYLSVNDPALNMMPSVRKTLSISNNICVFDFIFLVHFRQFWSQSSWKKVHRAKLL